ncbi:MAG TPA: glutaminyl-peptide cyclotransferase [Chitinophagaceae bacterium]|jgi:glutamine cyclotransferase|nr:glutaminyl-peptide cyclotransferase [Chitinophagaceae bacterium]
MNKKIVYSVAAIVVAGILFSCKNEDKPPVVPPPPPIPTITYSIDKTLIHDTSFYTQGLVIYKGGLYEGTGLEGKSRLMKIDRNTGNVLLNKNIDAKYFGEGVTILNDTVYQLTWRNHVVLLYNVKDLSLIKEIPLATEGWGITTDGKQLIVSDGSSNINFYEPGTFKDIRKVSVTENGEFVNNVNELEYINGYIYANRYQTNEILKIDPANGNVIAKMDFSQVQQNIRNKKADADVLNGIAYDSATKKVYVTGKLWPELYEITLGQ